ncbi:MAG TPA: hypothetical protein VM032_04820 [Vicinamibacterales bacterium]|nr:hypothetical protein [Vicinamibacterales bacterium]
MRWPPDAEAIVPDVDVDEPPLGAVLPLAVLVAAPADVVAPGADDADDEAPASVPVTSTWCPLCCASSESRPSRI